MQPASSSQIRDRKDICIYCREPLDKAGWKDELNESIHYIVNTCKNNHLNRLNLTSKEREDWISMIRLYLMEYSKKEKLKKTDF